MELLPESPERNVALSTPSVNPGRPISDLSPVEL